MSGRGLQQPQELVPPGPGLCSQAALGTGAPAAVGCAERADDEWEQTPGEPGGGVRVPGGDPSPCRPEELLWARAGAGAGRRGTVWQGGAAPARAGDVREQDTAGRPSEHPSSSGSRGVSGPVSPRLRPPGAETPSAPNPSVTAHPFMASVTLLGRSLAFLLLASEVSLPGYK